MNLESWIINTTPSILITFIILFIWSLTWKGLALWKAAKNDDKAWFVANLILFTFGILEIFYIYVFSKRDNNQ